MKNFEPVILGSVLFAGISGPDAHAMLGCLGARTARYGKNEYILRTGAATEDMGMILSGSASIVQESFWGERNIVAKAEPGQLFAEAFACTPGSVLDVGVVADVPTTVLFLNAGRIMTLCPSACAFHSRVVRNLLSSLAYKNLHFHQKLTHMGQRSTRKKLLSYLSAEALRQGSPAFDIPFNRQQLADYLSVDRSAMSLELCKLRDEGILTFLRNHFELFQQEGL